MQTGISVANATKKVKKVIETCVDEPITVLTLRVELPAGLNIDSAAAFRRLGRILLAHSENRPVYHGPRTDAFSKALVEAFGFDADNTRPI